MRQIAWLLLLIAVSLPAAGLNDEILAAARSGDVASIKALLEKGASIEATSPYGQTPLYVAAMSGHEQAVQLLLEKGANADVRDTFYKAPMLAFVIMRKHFSVAKMLIEKGGGNADENLTAAAGTGRTELVQAVLDHSKPSQAALDTTYETALDQKNVEIAELLKKAGAQPPAAAVEIDAAVLASYVGTFKSEQFPLDIKVFLKEGKLAMQATGQPDFIPKAKSVTLFEFLPAQLDVEFDSPDTFTLRQDGVARKFTKVVTP
ncbi:MAG: ankyrin repeat domain-containing protein [Bryobacterales bacterium]